MLHPYRVLKQNLLLQTVEKTYYHTLIDAYKACIPAPDSCCRLLYNGLEGKLEDGETLIRITCYVNTVFWIESLLGKSDIFLMPDLPRLKIDCSCHH
jgi:hypothetical protein